MLRTYPMYAVAALMITTVAMRAEDNRYNINVTNDTNQDLAITHPIPAHTIAAITVELTKIDPQEMLHNAIMANSNEEVIKAIQAGANVNCEREGKAPLLWAVLLKRDKAVDALLKSDARIAVKHYPRPLALCALQLGDIKSAIMLVRNGATILSLDDNNQTPMDYAQKLIASKDSATVALGLELMQEMFNHEYNINTLHPINVNIAVHPAYDYSRLYNFWCRALEHSVKGVDLRYLATIGADLNKKFYAGVGAEYTPLALAIRSRLGKDVIKNLVDCGADINLSINPSGPVKVKHTPLSLAVEFGQSDVIDFLLSLGAQL